MKSITIFAMLGAALAVQAQEDDLGLPQLQVPPPEPPVAAGYFLHDGVVYALIGDEALPVDKELMLRVTPRSVIGFDGHRVALPAGQMLLAEGGYAPLPTLAPEPAPIVPVASTPTPATTVTTVVTTNAPATFIPFASTATQPVPPPGPTLVPQTPGAVTAESPISPSTVPPPQPPFAAIGHPDRTGPRADYERPIDRTRPESAPNRRDDPTKTRDDQRPSDKTRPGTDSTKYRDRTNQGVDDYKRRDRTNQGPDDERPPDRTRQRSR